MKRYLLLSLCTLFSGLPMVAMEIDSITSKKTKEERGVVSVSAATPDSLQDLCCKVVAKHIDGALNPDTGIPNLGDTPNDYVEKIFKYSPVTAGNYDRLVLLLRWFKVNDQSAVQPKPKLEFSDKQSTLAALIVEHLDRMQSDPQTADQEAADLVGFIKTKNVLPDPAGRVAEGIVGRRTVNTDEMIVIGYLIDEMRYPTNELTSAPIRSVWNSIIQHQNDQRMRDYWLKCATNILNGPEAPNFDTMLLNFKYSNYDQLKTYYLDLRTKFLFADRVLVSDSLSKANIDVPLTIDELVIFNKIGLIKQEIQKSKTIKHKGIAEAFEERENIRQSLLKTLRTTLPEQEKDKINVLREDSTDHIEFTI